MPHENGWGQVHPAPPIDPCQPAGISCLSFLARLSPAIPAPDINIFFALMVLGRPSLDTPGEASYSAATQP